MKIWEVIKKTFIISLTLLLVAYCAILFVVPYFLNQNDYSSLLTEKLAKETGLVLKIQDYKIRISPNLNLDFSAKGAQLFYSDKRQILDVKNLQVGVSSFAVLNKEIKLNKFSASDLQFTTKLQKSGKTTLSEYLEKNVDKSKSIYKFSNSFPKTKIDRIVFKIKDEESGQHFKLLSKNFELSQNYDYRYLNLKLDGNFYCSNKKYLTFDSKFVIPKALFSNINNKLFDINFDNLYKQNFTAIVNSDLKIYAKGSDFDYVSGVVNIDNFVMVLDNRKLPPSYFHIALDKGKAQITSKFYTDKNEITDINANLKISKPYKIDVHCKSPNVDLSNLHKILSSMSELLNVKTNLSEYNVSGVLSSDFHVVTDLKNITSKGVLQVRNGKLLHRKLPFVVSQINTNIDFSNDSIHIKDSAILVNGQPARLFGVISSDSTGDLTAEAKDLDLNKIIKAFPVVAKILPQNLVIGSGKLNFNAKLNGKLLESAPIIKANIENVSLKEKILGIQLSLKSINFDVNPVKGSYSGFVHLNDIDLSSKNILNNSKKLHSDRLSIEFDKKDILIKPSKLTTGNANLILSGKIKDYVSSPNALIELKGAVDTDLLRQFVPNNIALKNKGYLPLKAYITAKNNIVSGNVKLLANSNNYITLMEIQNLAGSSSLTNVVFTILDNTLILNDLSLYKTDQVSNLINDINLSKYKKIITAKGKINNINIEKPVIDGLKIASKEILKIKVSELQGLVSDLSFDIGVTGSFQELVLNGFVQLQNAVASNLRSSAQNILINFYRNNYNVKIDNLKLSNMLMSVVLSLPVDFMQSNVINDIRLNADYIDIASLLKLSGLLKPAKYSPGNEFPYNIKSGKLYISKFKSGNINAQNVVSNIQSQNSVLKFTNLSANAYAGKVAGEIDYNFPYTSMNAILQGRGLQASSVAVDLLPKEQQLSGELNFDANLSMYGLTEEQQVDSLKGNMNIVIRNGHLGQLGRFEHFLYAQNLLSQKIINASLNSAKQAISPKNTGQITYLKGVINLKNGYAFLNPVLTSGPNMSMYITGSLGLKNNLADLSILGKVSSQVSSSLGVLGNITIKSLIDEHTKHGNLFSNLFGIYNSELPEIDISKIPALSPDMKYETKNFRVLISGDASSVTSVKSFTWVNPIGYNDKYLKKVDSSQVGSDTKYFNIINTQSDNNKTDLEQVQTKTNTDIINTNKMPDFLDGISDNFN